MLAYFFNWYHGAVWSNLLASILWAVPAIFWGRRHVNRIHDRLDELHHKQDLQLRELDHKG